MRSDTNVFLLYKIMPNKYIDNFSKGNPYFSCCGNWISIAKNGGDKGQGDKYEGVFAKYLRRNSRKPIQYYKSLFKDDLIVESEGEYILLKRKSSLYIPAICFYSVDNKTALKFMPDKEKNEINNIFDDNKDKIEIIKDDFPIYLSHKYFEEFNTDSDEIDAVMIQPRKFLTQLKKNGAYYNKVIYIDMDSEFDIFKDELYKKFFLDFNKAIENHIEIFFKDETDYAHQCELRAVINSRRLSGIKRGITIHLNNLTNITIKKNNTTPVDATGKDFICYVKNQYVYVRATLKKQQIK